MPESHMTGNTLKVLGALLDDGKAGHGRLRSKVDCQTSATRPVASPSNALHLVVTSSIHHVKSAVRGTDSSIRLIWTRRVRWDSNGVHTHSFGGVDDDGEIIEGLLRVPANTVGIPPKWDPGHLDRTTPTTGRIPASCGNRAPGRNLIATSSTLGGLRLGN